MSGAPLRLLLTGFEPFGGEPLNPSWELVSALAERGAGDGIALSIARLPVDAARYRPALAAALAAHEPQAVLAVGQATGRSAVHLETRARNLLDYGDAVDNDGQRVHGQPLVHDGCDLSSTLPLPTLCAQLEAQGLPVALSDDAGTYLCNAVLHALLHDHPELPAAFVHVPLLPEQAERRGKHEASLAFETSLAVLEALVRRLPEQLDRSA